jgi:hypothetical protein
LADGICAYGSCGVPDPDCLKDGQACQSAEPCTGHQCLTDAQHPSAYCTRACHDSGECQADMQCEFGVCRYPVLPVSGMGDACQVGRTLCSEGVCGGQSESTTVCRVACDVGDVCPGIMQCVVGVQGVKYCQGLAVLPAESQTLPAGRSRCSVTGAELGLTWSALAMLRRRARRHRT